MGVQVWEPSCRVQVVVESLGTEIISREMYKTEVTNGQLKASRYVRFDSHTCFKYLNSLPTFKSWEI